jgi:acetyl-CoA acyltransferase 1
MESMSLYDMTSSIGELNPRFFENPKAASCLMTMGETSENVAERYGVTRQVQDEFAAESQRRAAKAQKEGRREKRRKNHLLTFLFGISTTGRFDAEIVPVETTVKGNEGQSKTVIVAKDEGIRATTADDLAKLRPAFKQGGSTTAGNSSQVSDGAAAVLAMRRSVAKKLGLQPIGVFRGFSVVGVPPDVMGIGPRFAIPRVLEQTKLKIDDVDIFEVKKKIGCMQQQTDSDRPNRSCFFPVFPTT